MDFRDKGARGSSVWICNNFRFLRSRRDEGGDEGGGVLVVLVFEPVDKVEIRAGLLLVVPAEEDVLLILGLRDFLDLDL